MNEVVKYAGFWLRILAMVIDSIWLYGIIYTALYFIVGPELLDLDAAYSMTQIIFEWIIPAVVVMAYWMWKSATPGKMLLGRGIVDAETHEKAPGGRLFLRYVAYFISMIPLLLGFFRVGRAKRSKVGMTKLLEQF